jgi:hypothetical protein
MVATTSAATGGATVFSSGGGRRARLAKMRRRRLIGSTSEDIGCKPNFEDDCETVELEASGGAMPRLTGQVWG